MIDAGMRPPDPDRPGSGGHGGAGRRLHRRLTRRVHVRPAADLGRRRLLRPLRRRPGVRHLPPPHRPRRAGVAHPHRRVARDMPEREWNGPVVGLQERYREGLDLLGADFADVDGEEQDRRLTEHAAFTTPALRARVRGHVRGAGVRRQPGAWSDGRTSGSRATSSHAATATRRSASRDARLRRDHHRVRAGGVDRRGHPHCGRAGPWSSSRRAATT